MAETFDARDLANTVRAVADDLFTWMTSTDDDTGPEQINAWLGEQADKIEQTARAAS